MSQPTGSQPYYCRYCRQLSDPTARSCPRCGAPIDVRHAISDSGWEKQPPITDMARIQFGQSHVQIEGLNVPVADFTLSGAESIYFSHHVLLWTDPAAQLSNMPLKGAWKRMMAGMPLIMTQGSGPGHIALSENKPGEVIALPLQGGQRIWVKEHRFLAATGNITYKWTPTDVFYVVGTGDDRERHYPIGQFADIFASGDTPGLLLLHSSGNTFVRDLREGEQLLVQPDALLYKDMSVRVNLHLEYPQSKGVSMWRRMEYRNIWARLRGPGRVAVQSRFERPEGSEYITDTSYNTTRRKW
jgi:uncharacterized protein (AIM24 family)